LNSKSFPRVIHLQGKSDPTIKVTAFLGVYNGLKYLESMLEQLISQDSQKFNLLVVDNNSTDESLLYLKTWSNFFGDRITLVSNSINLGAHGSMRNNLDLIQTEWFAQIHQDDFYFSNHIHVLSQEIENSTPEIVAISTLMGSMTENGKRIGSPPRAAMFISDHDQPSALVQNLRTHCVPDPASAFRVNTYKSTLSQWHSTSFPDTEQILKFCAHGIFKYVPKETMLYRENPQSQSHSINKSESILGTYIALTRFFHSHEFISIFNLVENQKKTIFLDSIFNAIEFRLPNRTLFQLLKISILESLLNITEYSDGVVLSYSAETFSSLGFIFPSNLLLNLSKLHETHPLGKPSITRVRELLDFLEPQVKANPNHKKSLLSSIHQNFGHLIPLKLRVRLWRFFIGRRLAPGAMSQFNFKPMCQSENKDVECE